MLARILIADDHEDSRELLRLILAMADYEICEARDGVECVNIAKAQPPDLIMVDLSMPGLDGWQVFRELRTDERTSNIPCVAVTAHADFHRNRALATGFSGYLSKPFRGEELLDTVKQVLAEGGVKGNVIEAIEH